ncbi:MAG TPA: creatininase family protein [Bacteroidales bacterium]|nr:creatininase family protein [Bacteroidales bacterium]
MKHVMIAECTPTEFRQRLAEAPIAYLPLGTIEWHGEHLPLGADGLQSQGFFRELASEAGGMVFPMFFLGPDRTLEADGKEYYGMDTGNFDTSSGHDYARRQFDGSTYWVSDSLFVQMLEATVKQISRAGFRILVAHGHGPSTVKMAEHAAEWENKYHLKIFNLWGYRDEEGMGIMVDHAAMNETSITMALYPQLVKMEYLPADENTWPAGVGGKDPRKYASKEKGLEIIRIQKERMVKVLSEALTQI